MTDLFQKLTKKEELLKWLQERRRAKTSEVIWWGTLNHSNRAERNARQLGKEGKIKRMDEWHKIAIYGDTKEEAWVVNGE